MATSSTGFRPEQHDEGLGLIEIVVSMFLLALTAIAVLPVLIQGIQVSARNATFAAATQLVNQEIEQARLAASSSCASLLALWADADVSSTRDTRDVLLQPVREARACPTTFPGTVEVTAIVTADGDEVSRATTLILVNR